MPEIYAWLDAHDEDTWHFGSKSRNGESKMTHMFSCFGDHVWALFDRESGETWESFAKQFRNNPGKPFRVVLTLQ